MIADIIEGELRIRVPRAKRYRRFDESTHHRLSHCMKAVDFIVELTDRILFIEIKDPDQAQADPARVQKFVQELQSGALAEDLKYRYRDSFLYEWAAERLTKPVYYLVLIARSSLTPADLLARTEDLKRKLPTDGVSLGVWKRSYVAGCAVFNLASWNQQMPNYPASRVGP